MKRLIALMLAVAFALVTGCQVAQNPEKSAMRESLWLGTQQIRDNESKWAEKLVAYPIGITDPRTGQPSDGKNKASEITPLTPVQFQNGQATHKELQDLVTEDRARDTKVGE